VADEERVRETESKEERGDLDIRHSPSDQAILIQGVVASVVMR
jgi:hypothetical protein